MSCLVKIIIIDLVFWKYLNIRYYLSLLCILMYLFSVLLTKKINLSRLKFGVWWWFRLFSSMCKFELSCLHFDVLSEVYTIFESCPFWYAATTLTSWHLLVTFCSLHVALKMRFFEHKPFEQKAVMGFGILNGISIGLLNLSLGFNSVGFYQVGLLRFCFSFDFCWLWTSPWYSFSDD